jgi:Ca-activated chloride channel family protein
MLWRAPLWFWLLPAVVAVGALLFALLRRRARALAAFAEAPLAARLTPDLDRRRWSWRTALRLAALVLLVIALAGPKWGFHWQQMKRQGLDIIVAIDTSRSMLATDVKPNRLERAKLAVLDLVPLLQGDRIGLVPFAGTAFLESPLTMDYAAFERAVRSVEVGIIPRGGTALARAIDTSLAGFEAREGKYEALILITDGEDQEGDVQAAAERAKEQGVKIFTIGIGTAEGELLPLEGGGFVKDRSGQVVKSRLDEETLKQIALTTGGAYVHGIGPSLGLDQVFREHIAPMERREIASALQRQYEERFQIPLAMALLVLVVEGLVPLRRSRARARRRRQAGAAAVALCLPFLVGFLDPQGDSAAAGNQLYAAGKYEEAASKYGEGLIDAPASPLLQFNLATALYKQGKYDDALAALTKVEASGDPTWVARAAYNAGNAHYQIGAGTESSNPQATIKSWTQALVDYRRAMVADPKDLDAKFNHELVSRKLADLRKKLEEQKQQQEQQKQQQDQQDEQQKQDEQQQDQQQQQDQRQQDQQQGQQQQQEPQQPEAQEPQQDEQARDEAQQGGEQDDQQRPQPEAQGEHAPQQPQEQQAQPEVESGAPEAAAGAAGEPAPDTPEQQAAQAVIDTARGEELSPLEVDRPVGVAGSGEPARDW